jgi:hypothetical protein
MILVTDFRHIVVEVSKNVEMMFKVNNPILNIGISGHTFILAIHYH